ncbi:MAG: hypothetical protein WKF73_06015 [Nocardioidaceae bacterium]
MGVSYPAVWITRPGTDLVVGKQVVVRFALDRRYRSLALTVAKVTPISWSIR